MFHPDTSPDLPIGSDLLRELGVDRHTVREIAEDERAIRCPECGAVYPEYGFASLYPEPALQAGLAEPAPCVPWDPASSLPPVK